MLNRLKGLIAFRKQYPGLAAGRAWPPIGEGPYPLALAPYESVYLLLGR